MTRNRNPWFALGLMTLMLPAAQACDMHERAGFGMWAQMQYAQKLHAAKLAAEASRKSQASQRDAARDQPRLPAERTNQASEEQRATGSTPETGRDDRPTR